MFKGINHVTVVVSDKKIAEKFYFEILGLEKRIIAGRMLWAQAGEQFIHLTEQPDAQPQTTFSHFALIVEQLPSYIQQLIDKGVTVFDFDAQGKNKIPINLDSNEQIKQFFIADPDGNVIELIDSENKFFQGQLG